VAIALGPGESARAAFDRAWRDARRARQRRSLLLAALLLAAILVSAELGEMSLAKLVAGAPNLFDYIGRTLPRISAAQPLADLRDWYWNFGGWLKLLFDTIVIGFLGTVLGALGGAALCFTASRNLTTGPLAYFVSRRILEFARTVPELVYALIFVFAFGLGPLPGVLAIAVHSMGALGKLYAEVNENLDMRPVEGVKAAGGDWLALIRYAVVPQVLPNYASYTLLRFEINVRAAAIIGFVGAGGIGQELYYVIRQFIYTDISAIVLMIIVTVMIIDLACERLRHAIIGREQLA
jgi:phosphonate transport system permease protein